MTPAMTWNASVDIVLQAFVTRRSAILCDLINILLVFPFSRSLQPAVAFVVIGSYSPLYKVRMYKAACPRPHFALATLGRLLNSFWHLCAIFCTCRMIFRPLSRCTPRYLIACLILILLPLILMIGGLSASNMPLTSSISVFCAGNASFFLERQAETQVIISCPLSCFSRYL